METLNHLLADVFNADADKYEPIRAWTNPFNDNDYLCISRLASRRQREKEYNIIASVMNIQVNAKGRCERDAMVLVSKLYSVYASALRSDFTDERPAQP
eukprot:2036451-Prymnesium_polylepis.1